MAPIVTSAEIGRPDAEVFACATDPTRFSQWQKGVVDGHMDGPADGTGTPAAGATCVTTRRIGGATLWVPNIPSPHATWAYSWIRPPSRSRLRTRAAGLIAGGYSRSSGAL